MARPKIALIGGGNIGGVLAQLIALARARRRRALRRGRGRCRRARRSTSPRARRLVGSDVRLAGTNDYKDIAGADLVIITAGLARKPGMSRDDLLKMNLGIIKQVAEGVKKHAPKADRDRGLEPARRDGLRVQAGLGLPEAARGRAWPACSTPRASAPSWRWELGVSVQDVTALVLGGHGDTMVPLPALLHASAASRVAKLLSKDEASTRSSSARKNAGGEVVALLKTGSAFVSPALSARSRWPRRSCGTRSACSPAPAYLEGEYGVTGLYVGVPVRARRGRRREGDRDRARPGGAQALRRLGRPRAEARRRRSGSSAMNVHEYQAKALLRDVRRRGARRASSPPRPTRRRRPRSGSARRSWW